ncbi:inosine/xanthosine triphosphatase [Candidatus Micrarchaeota archaeon]|nr:inosine/xanthosine triphosphatase [Candidatus Micrarchaeota archaeon]
MKCFLGGTFNIIHKGHEKLFNAAFTFDEIVIGLTSDRFVSSKKTRIQIPYKIRKANLEKFLFKLLKNKSKFFAIIKIEDEFGPTLSEDGDAIVVSSETESVAEEINKKRVAKKLKPLNIISVPIVYAQDYIKISSSRIQQKKIDSNGKRISAVIFSLGTLNPSKKQGLGKAAKKIFGKFRIKTLRVDSGINEQPFDQETVQGAENRAKAAYYATNADFGIGFESGIFNMAGRHHDIAICAIFDGEKTTFGNSMGFQMPSQAIELLSEHNDLGAVMEELSGINKIGYKKGAIHYLSAGLLSRQEMNEQAFLCAMIPRISEAKGIFRY